MRRFWDLGPGEVDSAVSQVLRHMCVDLETPTIEEAERLAQLAWYPAPDDFVVFIDPLDGLPIEENEVIIRSRMAALNDDLMHLFAAEVGGDVRRILAEDEQRVNRLNIGAVWHVAMRGRSVSVSRVKAEALRRGGRG